MNNYDINNPYDIDVIDFEFDSISIAEWDDYIEFAKTNKIGFNKIGVLIKANRQGSSRRLSTKQKLYALQIIEGLDNIIQDKEKDTKTTELLKDSSFRLPPTNLTLRVAWHDNKWNGSICKDPENNTYCNGFHSLLSERIRKRKDENFENEIKYAGKFLKDIDYLPPCFWSINLFGKDVIQVSHDNPAATKLENIDEELNAMSMYSWPFAISFARNREIKHNGAYPKNLENTRIPRFTSKVHEGQSIAFMYSKYSNPLTEEEQQYLVIGAGIVSKKQNASDIKHFGPKHIIDEIKKRPQGNNKYRNFPSMNWAMQFSFEDYSTVRMPYHEYLDEAEKLDDNDKDNFLNKIKVAIYEPELEWCFKYVAMDIGDDEAIYILTKMRKALIECKNDGVVSLKDMEERIYKVEQLLEMAWNNRSYFPGFKSISRIILNKEDEPYIKLDDFYKEFKEEYSNPNDEALLSIIENPSNFDFSKKYRNIIEELQDRLHQRDISIIQFLKLSMLNLKPFQFNRILDGKLELPEYIRNFDNDVKKSHNPTEIIDNPYVLYEDYMYYPDSHDDVFGEDNDAPIDLFKIDIAYFPHTRFLDRIPLQRKMNFNDKKRIRALVLRHLNELGKSGHCFSNADILQEAIKAYPLYYEIGKDYVLSDNFFYPISSEFANHFQESLKHIKLVEANETLYYYKSKIYDAENELKAKFNELLNSDNLCDSYSGIDNYINKSIQKLSKDIGNDFDISSFTDERKSLYNNIFSKKLFVLSGSAGSGKSYEILNIISYLKVKKGQNYLVLAPTGKAALRLSSDKDFPNIVSSTIDKYLSDVKHNKIPIAKRNSFSNIIIDETSMVDLVKFSKLIKTFNFANPSFKRLILVGDPNQLPAIGYGRVLADLMNYLQSNPNHHNNFIKLETNCRATLQGNKILQLAESFKTKGEIDTELFKKFRNKEEVISKGFRVKYWSNKEELYAQIKSEFELLNSVSTNLSDKLNEILGISYNGKIINDIDLENFQILSPYYAQYSGASKINYFIQSTFKNNYEYSLRKNTFKKSDKLIRTRNYYEGRDLLLSNGTLGIIDKNKEESFYYENSKGLSKLNFREIRSSEKEFFDLAYAITVHKSQGSGFNHLFLILPARFGLLSKELLYTALTRTKKTITIFIQSTGQDNNVFEIAANRSFSASRRTSLMLDKPFRYYDLEPEKGVFVSSRVELLIYHILLKKRDELGKGVFDFRYEEKPIINNITVNIKTDFTILVNGKIWYWEHLGLIGQKKYDWTWKNIKIKTYKKYGIWDNVLTTDETNGINPTKIESIVNSLIKDEITSEDKYNKFSKHHYFLR